MSMHKYSCSQVGENEVHRDAIVVIDMVIIEDKEILLVRVLYSSLESFSGCTTIPRHI